MAKNTRNPALDDFYAEQERLFRQEFSAAPRDSHGRPVVPNALQGSDDDVVREVNSRLTQDPQVQSLLEARQYAVANGLDRNRLSTLDSRIDIRLRQLGYDPNRLHKEFDKQGSLVVAPQSWWNKHSGQVLAAAAMGWTGVGAAMAIAGAASAASASGATAAGTGGTAATAAGTGATAAGTGAATATGVGATGATAAGGTTAALLPELLSTGSEIVSGIEQARAANRKEDADFQQIQDRTAVQRAAVDQNRIPLEIQQQQFLADEYGRSVNEAVRGGLFQGLEDVKITAPAGIKMGSISGGLRPSAIAGRYDLGRQLQEQALNRMRNPTKLADIPAVPELTPPEQQSGVDTALGYTSAGLGVASQALPYLARSRRKAPTLTGNAQGYSA